MSWNGEHLCSYAHQLSTLRDARAAATGEPTAVRAPGPGLTGSQRTDAATIRADVWKSHRQMSLLPMETGRQERPRSPRAGLPPLACRDGGQTVTG